MADANVLTHPASRNRSSEPRRRRLYSLEGLPWPTAWEKHRRLAEAMEAQGEAEKQPDSRRE
jgi:hypothetical protein